ncbi:hypothetical protein [Enterococcus casseliflavus]|uniref:hypothetical protein n=1 Tax=Enterococcus casseliflavus TaxID=37734 RepID=UPI0039A5D77B
MRDPQLLQLLGPDMKVAPQVVQQTKEQVQNYTLEHLLLRLNQEEDVPAYFAYPSSQQPVPLVLFNHMAATSRGGKKNCDKVRVICKKKAYSLHL